MRRWSHNVVATAYAEIQTAATPCVIATNTGGTGISATGVTVTASSCEVASNENVSALSGGNITASAIYAYTFSAGSNLHGTQHTVTTPQPDPFQSANVFSRIATVQAQAAPSVPSGSAPTGGSTVPTCNTANPTPTVYPGSYTGITIDTGCTTITFNNNGSSSAIFNISGGIKTTLWDHSTTAMSFAAGTYNINGITIGSPSNTNSSDLYNITISTTGA